jgi:serine/threonine protein kinase/tetratricopeptide (TPR) repeat protein
MTPPEGWDRAPRTLAIGTAVHAYSDLGVSDDFVLGGGLPDVPGYEVLAELGRGGMGVVYKARQLALKRLVALKMIRNASPNSIARFEIEAEAVARLTHPNIVQIHQVGVFDGQPFLSLEYVDGPSLEEKLACGMLDEQQAAQLIETLARAMHHAHERGILHRDLKPANILLVTCGVVSGELSGETNHQPKITDFGLAKFLDVSAGPTRADGVIGTPSYMAPEQAAGNSKAIGVTADVYSLGAILYEVLTGRAPFVGGSLLQTLEQVRSLDAIPPRRFHRGLSPELETICLKCLEKDPDRRYPSAAALADDLRNHLDGKPITARPSPNWRQLTRTIRNRPVLVARSAGVAALTFLLGCLLWYLQVAGQLQAHRATQREQQFVRLRNEAFFHGILTAEQGALFTGSDAATGWETAETAAREALSLAGLPINKDAIEDHTSFPVGNNYAIKEDCYALMLVLANAQLRQVGGREAVLPRMLAGSHPELEVAKRYRFALQLLDRANELGIETRTYHLRRAELLEYLEREAEASEHRNRAAVLKPRGALDHFLLGEERFRSGGWVDAMRSFNQALTLRPSHFWSQFFLAVCQLRLQRWEAARAGLTSCLAQQPDFVWANLFRSLANEQLHARSEAEADFARALHLHPGENARYVLHLTRGVLHYRQKELDQAAADFRVAIELRPQQYNARLNLAHVYMSQKEFDEAEMQFSHAMRLGPPSGVVVAYHVERGRKLYGAGKDEQAIEAAQTALTIDSVRPEPHEVSALALLRLGRFAQAERSFDLYLQHGGNPLPDVFRARGLARMKQGRYPEAVEDYTRVLQRCPDTEIYQHRGWAHFFADAWKLALRDFSTAIEMAPGQGDARVGRGLALVMLGRYREAVDEADSGLRSGPVGASMMLNIACILAQAAARAEADVTQSERQALAARYRNRAIETVRRTLRMLPADQRRTFWEQNIVPDAALAPIRSEELAALQREFFASSETSEGGKKP